MSAISAPERMDKGVLPLPVLGSLSCREHESLVENETAVVFRRTGCHFTPKVVVGLNTS